MDRGPSRTPARGAKRVRGAFGTQLAPVSSLEWLPVSIRQRATVRELAAGDILFRQGDKAAAIFEVQEGRLRLMRLTIDSRPVVLHTARKGDLFAEAALFANTYHCDALAAVASRVCVYPKRELLVAFRNDPATGERFMALLAGQIHLLRTRLEERNIRSARERVLHHLALTAGKGGRTVRLEGSLMDLAAELGMTHEALYRTLASLQKAGLIVKTRSEITLRKGSFV
jgi:CRP/FNR family transcriptional regulator, dissimilatory nitrate respiration regulator